MSDKPKNALAELAERLKNGIYNNPNDARFDKPVVCASLDANDVLAAQRIVAELAKVLPLYMAGESGHTFIETVAYKAYRNCRAIAEEGAGDGK